MSRRIVTICVVMLAVACGEKDRSANNIRIDPTGNNSSQNNETQTNNDTTSTNNDTTSTNNQTSATNNQTSATNNTTTATTNNQTQAMVTISGTATEGAEDPPVLPISCAIRLYNPNLINANDPDLFAGAVVRQEPFTISQWPTTWSVDEVPRDPVYAGILCDRDDDQQLDMIGGWHTAGGDQPQAITAPAQDVDISVNRL